MKPRYVLAFIMSVAILVIAMVSLPQQVGNSQEPEIYDLTKPLECAMLDGITEIVLVYDFGNDLYLVRIKTSVRTTIMHRTVFIPQIEYVKMTRFHILSLQRKIQ